MNAAERQRPPAGELYLDHLGHFVPDLDAAAAVWQKLGFAVTPNSERVRERMKRFVGVHLACFGTPDAQAEQARLAAHGFDPEAVVKLERKIETGASVRFRVVYVPPAKMPEGRVQYCEHLTPRQVWREGYVNPFRLSAVYLVADDPEEVAARWAR